MMIRYQQHQNNKIHYFCLKCHEKFVARGMNPGQTSLVLWKEIGSEGQCNTCRKVNTAIIPTRFNLVNMRYENVCMPIDNMQVQIRESLDRNAKCFKIQIEKRQQVVNEEICQHTIFIHPNPGELARENMFPTVPDMHMGPCFFPPECFQLNNDL